MKPGDDLPKATSFWLFGIIPPIILSALFVYVLNQANRFPLLQMGVFSLIIAGDIGNIIDPFLYDRHVTDFMNIGVDSVRTGIFNVADVCVTTGVIGLLVMHRKKKLPYL